MEQPADLLIATPNPAQGSVENGLGAVTLTWNAVKATDIEIRIDAPDGSLLTHDRASGRITTANWVTDGTVFYLQNVTDGLPLTGENTLARVTVRVDSLMKGLLVATPNPIRFDASGLEAGTLTWTSNVVEVEIRLDAPDGDLFVRGGIRGSITIPHWVTDGTIFYLQNVSKGLPLTPENTLDSLTLSVVKIAAGSLIATPNPIRYDGSGLEAGTLTWTSNITDVEIRLDAPDGDLIVRGGVRGSIAIPNWVTDGTVFYLQNVTDGLPLTPENTLASLILRVTKVAAGSLVATPNPIRYDGSGLEAGTLTWTSNITDVEIRLDAPDGDLIVRGGVRGSIAIPNWVTDGTVFYLQNVTDGLPLTPENTLASLILRVTKVAAGSLVATPNPIPVFDGSGLAAGTLTWISNITEVEIRVDAPDGRRLLRDGASGSITTPKWVTDGTVFYLQNVTDGLPLSPENTLATVAVHINSDKKRKQAPSFAKRKHTPGAVRAESQVYAAHQSNAFDIICFPIIDWDFRFQRPQQIMTQFAAAGHRVFYLTQEFRFSGPPYEIQEKRRNIYEVSLRGPKRNIYRDILTEAECEKLFKALDALRKDLYFGATAAFIQLPFWWPLADRAKSRFNWSIIYDCMDHLAGFSSNAQKMLALEKDLISSADLVVVSSSFLENQVQHLNPNYVLIRNACDYHHFAKTGKRRNECPIIGYYGEIGDWFDADLVADLAHECSEWDFVLVGSTYSADVSRLVKMANVSLVGEVPYVEIPDKLTDFDVTFIPFKRVPLTEATNPVKAYEILAAGKPLVSVPIPEVVALGELVRLASTAEDFKREISAALAEDDPGLIEKRRAFAKEHTWKKRYEVLAPVVTKTFAH